jgi:hypothetical protein
MNFFFQINNTIQNITVNNNQKKYFLLIFILEFFLIAFVIKILSINIPLHSHIVRDILTIKHTSLSEIFFSDLNYSLLDSRIINKESFLDALFYNSFHYHKEIISNQWVGNNGYVYLAYFFIKTLFFIPPFLAAVFFHSAIHFLLCFNIIVCLKKKLRFYFVMLYFLNPFVVYFIIYPNPYFLLSISGFIILRAYLRNKYSIKEVVLSTIILLSVFFTRSAAIGFVLAYVVILIYKKSPYLKYFLIIFFLFTSIYFFLKTENINRVWHTVFAGYHAYKQDNQLMLDDNISNLVYSKNKDFKKKPDSFSQEYLDKVKELVLYKLENDKITFVKNFIFNSFSLFSYGYKFNNYYYFTLFNVFIGFLLFFLFFSQFPFLTFLIYIIELPWIFYYPPIVGYRFGTLILLSYLLTITLNKIFSKKSNNTI